MSKIVKLIAVMGLLLGASGLAYGFDPGLAPEWRSEDQAAGLVEENEGTPPPSVTGIDGVRDEVLGQSQSTAPSPQVPPESRLEKNLLPEPLSVAVWSLIGVTWAALGIWRRRAAMVHEGAGSPGRARRSWPEENRIAIRAMIERGRHDRGGL